MKLAYNSDSNIVLASINSNSNVDVRTIASKMFSWSNLNVSFCELDIPQTLSVIGCKVYVDSGIAHKIVRLKDSEEKVVFEISKEDLKGKIEELKELSRKNFLEKFPFNCVKSSPSSFLDKIARLPQTYQNIREDINANSYFDSKVTKVGWWGSFTDAGGYACMNRSIVTRLHNFHILPYIKMYPTIPQIEHQVAELLNCYLDLTPKKGNHPFVYAYTPMSHEYHGGKRIFFTMFETATLHPVFVNHCNKFSDEIWVPSKANREVFVSSGIKKTIRVVPLGIDETIYLNENKSSKKFSGFIGLYGMSPEKGLKKFKFVTVIQWNFRKGYDVLIKSFVDAFTDKDDVCLVITTQYSSDVVLNDLNQYIPRRENLPQVVLYNWIIPTIDMPAYYKQFDCYVHFSRGEGFSLTQIEAAACGLPVISCYHSGMTEYLTEQNSYPIHCDELEKGGSKLDNICFYYQGQMLWKLGKKQIDAATEFMRYVLNNYSEAKERAKIFYSEILDKYTWDKATERISDIIKTL